MEGYIAQIIMFGGNFAPRNWAFCNGQLLAIASNQALFSLIGTIYGGDGRTTFALPDLRGRVPMHAGSGPGLTPRPLGQKSGAEAVTLSLLEMPQHNHIATTDAKMYAEGRPGNSVDPTGNMLAAQRAGGTNMYRANVAAEDVQMDSAMVQATTTIGSSGSSQPHFNMQPYTAVNFVICLQGIFPSRS